MLALTLQSKVISFGIKTNTCNCQVKAKQSKAALFSRCYFLKLELGQLPMYLKYLLQDNSKQSSKRALN